MPRGRPTVYDPEIAKIILQRIADGELLKHICSEEGMPPSSTVHQWVTDDREGFAAPYARARESWLEGMAEEIVTISDDGTNDWMDRQREYKGVEKVENAEAIARSKLRVDTRKWLLARLLHRKYGDKLEQTVQGPEGGPVVIITGVPRREDDK